MPQRDILYLNNSLEVLRALLVFGRKVKFRRRVIGFGLHESDFGKGEIPVTRKIVRSRTAAFLKSRYVKELKTTDCRSKGYFSITPLGIVHLFQNREIKENNEFKRTVRYLQFFIEFNSKKQIKQNKKPCDPISDFKLIDKQINEINKQLLSQTLTYVLRCIEIKSIEDGTQINLLYVLDDKVFLNVKRFIIKEDTISEIDFQENTSKKIAAEEFDHYLSLFILLTFHHRLFLYFIKQNNKKMYDSYDINLLKEVDAFNVVLSNEIFPNFDDFVNIQVNIEKRLKNLAQSS